MALVHSNVLLQALSSFTGVAVKAYTNLEKPEGEELTSFLLQASTPLEILNTGSRKELFVNMDKFCDLKFDYDCTNVKDDTTFTRGNEPYIRPFGWKRIALKVLDKYPDGNAWLGTDGWRSHSVDGEWPVSYHGTSMFSAKSIIESNYKAGSRERFGRGIYSTSDNNEAAEYSEIFTCEETGKRYKVLLQNRIHPKMRKMCSRQESDSNYWLIGIPLDTNHGEEKAIVENAIRPYGILLKEV
ncbi:uncharacterized protein [Chanodichthys erythropterus]|uniref:uncharacterized protein n=1 Tax=Chanodichthys erythropterus TaxID=933992 RepID=UPI00351EB1F0